MPAERPEDDSIRTGGPEQNDRLRKKSREESRRNLDESGVHVSTGGRTWRGPGMSRMGSECTEVRTDSIEGTGTGMK